MSGGQADLRAYARMFWRWKLLFLAIVIVIPLGAYLLVSRETPVYQSSLLLEENPLPVDTSLFTSGAAPLPAAATQSETLYGQARVIETPAVARLAAARLHPRPAQSSSLLSAITATADPTTGFITITAQSADPRRAAAIANAFGEAVVRLRASQAIGVLTTAIDELSAQLARMGAHSIGRGQLSGQIQRLRALRAAQGDNAQILQRATPAASPVSPKTTKVVALAIVLALLLAIGAVFLAEAVDRRLRQPEDVEELTGLPLLAVVPDSAFGARALPGVVEECFHMLRSTLMYFNVDRPLSTVMITSPMKGDGKTTVATRLAIAAALGGREVILIEADLRRPQAAARLGLAEQTAQAGRGLAGVLSGQLPLSEALVDVPLHDPADDHPALAGTQGRLRLLAAGGSPPNPSELLSSRQLRELLSKVSELADLVLIDTNPLLSVSDSLPLLDLVSGVVVVARLNHTTRDAVRRLQKVLANTSATVLGVVATGAASSGLYGRYGYGSGYRYEGYGSAANGNGRAGRRRLLRRSA